MMRFSCTKKSNGMAGLQDWKPEVEVTRASDRRMNPTGKIPQACSREATIGPGGNLV